MYRLTITIVIFKNIFFMFIQHESTFTHTTTIQRIHQHKHRKFHRICLSSAQSCSNGAGMAIFGSIFVLFSQAFFGKSIDSFKNFICRIHFFIEFIFLHKSCYKFCIGSWQKCCFVSIPNFLFIIKFIFFINRYFIIFWSLQKGSFRAANFTSNFSIKKFLSALTLQICIEIIQYYNWNLIEYLVQNFYAQLLYFSSF